MKPVLPTCRLDKGCTAIVWLTRAAGFPAATPSVDWSMNQRDSTSMKGHSQPEQERNTRWIIS